MSLLINLFFGQFTQLSKTLCRRPRPTHCKEVAMRGGYEYHSHAAGPANGFTMVEFFFGQLLPYGMYVFLPHIYLGAKGMSKTMFLPLVPMDGVEYFLGGKGMFMCFMFSQTMPVDTALIYDW